MNKLTEIKEAFECFKKTSDKYFFSISLSNMEHLLSLLEEKDKAIAFYAEHENYKTAAGYFISNDSKVTSDKGNIARKVLNTSSNSEGE